MRTVMIVIVAALLATASERQENRERPLTPQERAQLVDRGRYFVHRVAMCVMCHSPRTDEGELIEQELLTGGAIPLEGPYEEEWAFQAPHLAGLPGYSREALVRLLTEGVGRDGEPPRPPMPPFRMKQADAEAVAYYLGSLE